MSTTIDDHGISDMADEVVQACRALAAAGLGDMVWGHAAIRDPDGQGLWMKAAGWGFEEVSADHVLLVSPDGEVLSGTGARHIEYPIHAEIMRRRPDVGCSVHTHAPALSAFSCLDTPLLPISHDGVMFCDPPVPRFTQTGALIDTADLGAARMQAVVNAAPTAVEGARVQGMISALVSADVDGGYLVNPGLARVHWQAGETTLLPPTLLYTAFEERSISPLVERVRFGGW